MKHELKRSGCTVQGYSVTQYSMELCVLSLYIKGGLPCDGVITNSSLIKHYTIPTASSGPIMY